MGQAPHALPPIRGPPTAFKPGDIHRPVTALVQFRSSPAHRTPISLTGLPCRRVSPHRPKGCKAPPQPDGSSPEAPPTGIHLPSPRSSNWLHRRRTHKQTPLGHRPTDGHDRLVYHADRGTARRCGTSRARRPRAVALGGTAKETSRARRLPGRRPRAGPHRLCSQPECMLSFTAPPSWPWETPHSTEPTFGFLA